MYFLYQTSHHFDLNVPKLMRFFFKKGTAIIILAFYFAEKRSVWIEENQIKKLLFLLENKKEFQQNKIEIHNHITNPVLSSIVCGY